MEAVIRRAPQFAVVDEQAHTNVPGSKNRRRYEDVLELLDSAISVITVVNVQHLGSLNDSVTRTTAVRVQETVLAGRFPNEVREANMQVVPLGETENGQVEPRMR